MSRTLTCRTLRRSRTRCRPPRQCPSTFGSPATPGPCRKTTTSRRADRPSLLRVSPYMPTLRQRCLPSTPTARSRVRSSTSSFMSLNTSSLHTLTILIKTPHTRLRLCGRAAVRIAAQRRPHLSSSIIPTASGTSHLHMMKARHTAGEVPCSQWWKTRTTCHRRHPPTTETLAHCRIPASKVHIAIRTRPRRH
jgi:hypothetical protein